VELSVKQIDGVTIVEPRGRLDTSAAPQFQEQFEELVRTGARRLLVDMHRVRYISSFGFRALLLASRYAERNNGKMVLCAIPPEVMEVVELGGFSEVFTICFSREDALRTIW